MWLKTASVLRCQVSGSYACVGEVVEYVADENACCLARLGLASPVEDEAIGDALEQRSGDLLDLRALIVRQHRVRLGEQVEDGELWFSESLADGPGLIVGEVA